MADLSPAAEAVLDAYSNHWTVDPYEVSPEGLAAALRAAAGQILAVEWNGQIPADTEHQLGVNWARDALHVLANELEGQAAEV